MSREYLSNTLSNLVAFLMKQLAQPKPTTVAQQDFAYEQPPKLPSKQADSVKFDGPGSIPGPLMPPKGDSPNDVESIRITEVLRGPAPPPSVQAHDVPLPASVASPVPVSIVEHQPTIIPSEPLAPPPSVRFAPEHVKETVTEVSFSDVDLFLAGS